MRDQRWWHRLNILLGGLARRKNGQIATARLAYYAALVVNPKLDGKHYVDMENNLQEAYYALSGHLKPWEGTQVNRQGKEFDTARQKYIDATGVDPADPKFKEWEAQKIKEMLADNGPPSLSPEQELAERFAKKRKKKKGR